MTDVVFIRHGQSTWNLEHRVQGQRYEPPLTELGRRQSRVAAGKVRDIGAALLLSSDQVRAAQTAQIVATEVRLPVHYDARLREHDHGELTGLTTDEALRRWGSDPDTPYDPDAVQGGTGESARQVHERVMTVLRGAMDSGPAGPVIVVGHGSAIQLAIAGLLEEDLTRMQWRQLENGSVARVRDGRYELL